jgi:methyl-accepting chemotaxis protein
VERSNQAIDSIKDQIEVLAMGVAQVATAAEEQSATTAGITSNMHLISQVISNSSHDAQTTRHAASELATSASRLQEMVNRFKLA